MEVVGAEVVVVVVGSDGSGLGSWVAGGCWTGRGLTVVGSAVDGSAVDGLGRGLAMGLGTCSGMYDGRSSCDRGSGSEVAAVVT